MEHCSLEQAWHAYSDHGPQLRELHLSHCSFSGRSDALSDALQAAAACLNLLDLSHSSSPQLAEVLSLLASSASSGEDECLPCLERVDLRGMAARASDLCQLQSAAPRLRQLQLGDCSMLDDLGLAALSGMSCLRALELGGVEDAALPWLQLLGALEELSVSGRQLTGKAQRRRQQQQQLQQEESASGGVSAGPGGRRPDLQQQQRLQPEASCDPGWGALVCLRSLSLLDSSFSAAGLSGLLPLAPHLTSLRLESECLKDRGLAHVASLTALRSLALSTCWQLTGRGLLRHLTGLSHLSRLELQGCPQVSGQDLSLLIKSCPALTEVVAPDGTLLLAAEARSTSRSTSASSRPLDPELREQLCQRCKYTAEELLMVRETCRPHEASLVPSVASAVLSAAEELWCPIQA
jgi:hypothetical protein